MKNDPALPERDPGRGEITGVLLFFMVTRIILKIFGLRRTYLLYHRFSRAPRSGSGLQQKTDLYNARLLANRYKRINEEYSLFGASCLVESYALWWRLRRAGIRADLRMGVRTLTGRFESHAWVEYIGEALNDIENIAEVFTSFDLSRITPDSSMS